MIAEMLGVPGADQARFQEWSDAIVTPVFEDEEMERFSPRWAISSPT